MAPYHRISVRVRSTLCCVVAAVLAFAVVAPEAGAQDTTPRWRGVYVDTFNTRLGTPDEVTLAVTRATAMHANVLFVQVRRRGDAFYLDAVEPLPDGVPIDGGFDPLGNLLSKARAAGLEVHALLTIGPVWHLSTAPSDPRHVFNRHGFSGSRIVEGAENWLTRTLVPDGNGSSMDGYRFGTDYWLDFGHPAAVDYVVELVTRLVERYPVDGVRLDGLQYPEAPGGTASVGYNAVSVARFQARAGASGVPNAVDARWSDWRREQITALARRVTASVFAVRPSVVVSVSGVVTGRMPGDTRATIAYARSFQDWFAWAADGSVDVVVPQVYRAAHTATGVDEFDSWIGWVNATPTARPVVISLGGYMNSLEGLLAQAHAAIAAAGPVGGVSFFSLAANNAPVVNNPLSAPAGRDTPQRPFEDVASALRTGRTTSGQVVDHVQPGLFTVVVPRAAAPWKDAIGYVLGRLVDGNGAPVDGAHVFLDSTGGTAGPDDVVSDGTGVFSTPGMTPGTYRLRVVTPTGSAFIGDCTIDVSARAVARITLGIDPSRTGVAICR